MNSILIAFAALAAGIALGAAIAWLLAKSRHGVELATALERLRLLEQEHERLRSEHARDMQQLQALQNQLVAIGKELATVSTRLEEERKQADEKITLLREVNESGKKALTDEFQNLANTILEDKTRRFTEQNQENLGLLLNPFKERLNEFKSKVEEIHYHDTQQQAAMKVELAQLKELNRQMTEEAHDLATALKGQAKKQGNWGELILDNVLARSGLQLGKDYRREVSFNTEDGKQRPDVIIYLPQNKHLIIDAKVSLNAYTRFVNAEDELERKQAIKEHVAAVADRITELADRRYFELGEINSPEMVFMFIPIESAFVEALRADETLFQQALEQNVLVATPTTLLTSLNIVRQLWRFENQNAHSAELAESAAQLYQKLAGFIGSMEELGRKLDSAKTSFNTAFNQLTNGRGNLVKKAKDFERLGVSVQKALPQYLLDRAELELDFTPQALDVEAEEGEADAP
jgi:DNA recombination protein RmuC